MKSRVTALLARSSAFLPILLLAACDTPRGEAENLIRRDLLDPDAAQFRDMERCVADRAIWRGEINAKNAYGAYTGFKLFYFSDYRMVYIDDADFGHMMKRCFGPFAADFPTESPSGAPSM